MTTRVPACLGLGCSALGRDDVSEHDAVAVVERALDVGFRLLDTAPHYGAGLSERRVGSALRGVPRTSYVLSTKIGRRIEPPPGREERFLSAAGRSTVHDYTADAAWRTLEGSLERLDTDHVDVLHIHDPLDVPAALAGLVPALVQMREQGLIRSIGCGMNHTDLLSRVVASAPLDVAMIASGLNLLDRDAEAALLPTAAARGTAVWVAGVYATGVLAGRDSYRYRPVNPAVAHRVDELRGQCARHGVPLQTAAIQMPWRYHDVTRVIVGARSVDDVEGSAAAATEVVPEALWDELAIPPSTTRAA